MKRIADADVKRDSPSVTRRAASPPLLRGALYWRTLCELFACTCCCCRFVQHHKQQLSLQWQQQAAVMRFRAHTHSHMHGNANGMTTIGTYNNNMSTLTMISCVFVVFVVVAFVSRCCAPIVVDREIHSDCAKRTSRSECNMCMCLTLTKATSTNNFYVKTDKVVMLWWYCALTL